VSPPAAYPPHVLVIDDDARLRRLLARFLGENGFMVSTAADAGEARRHLAALQFDLLVVDVMMPGENGLALTKDIRANTAGANSAIPILMLTAMGETRDRIAGLEQGADDYMSKPFEPRELVLRINSILRRTPKTESVGAMELRFGDCRYDLARQSLSRNGEAVHLTAGEAELLHILARSAGTPVDRGALAAAAEEGANPRTIDVQITRLRRKIEPDPRQPRYLQTVRGTGYLLRTD
jgi:two-component system phosphate regulon response regulator OmpR